MSRAPAMIARRRVRVTWLGHDDGVCRDDDGFESLRMRGVVGASWSPCGVMWWTCGGGAVRARVRGVGRRGGRGGRARV